MSSNSKVKVSNQLKKYNIEGYIQKDSFEQNSFTELVKKTLEKISD